MPQNTNLNVSPYFDDFDESKNYQKVLFKPGTPIQARELTTLQTILQNQIEKFGQHFFKEGSMVIPGQIAYDPNYTCVQINENHLGIPVSVYIESFVGKLIKGQTSGVIAKVENYINFSESDKSTYTLYVKYISSSDVNFTTSSFVNGENLISLSDVDYSISTIRTNTTFATTIPSNSTEIGSAAKIAEGIYFIRGFFVRVSPQTIILDQYTNTPSYRVGLLINEEIAVASNDYDDLYDNAQGFSNFAAPGADRLVISTELIKKDINDLNDENFIELLRIRNGEVEKFVEQTDYNLIRDEIAKRTYDESGDYYIRPFKLALKESLNDRIGNNGVFFDGELTRQGNTARENLGCISISPGKAYVRGYEVETKSTLLDFAKPRTTDRILDENLQVNLGNQLVVNNVYGSIPVGLNLNSQVLFYDDRNIIPGKSNGNLVGVSKVYNYEARNSLHSGPQTQYVVSLYDTQLFTKIKVNAEFSNLEAPVLIEGKNSGARGFLYESISNTDELSLYDVSGRFIINEPLRIDGVDSSRIIRNIIDYQIGDVGQVVCNEGNVAIGTFTSDTILSNKTFISDIGEPFTILAEFDNKSNVIAPNIFFNLIKVGDIVTYTKPGDVLPTYNKIHSINESTSSFIISPTTNVSGVSTGTLPNTQITVTDLRKVETNIINPSSDFYLPLKYRNASNIDFSKTSITVKRTFFDVDVDSSSFTFVLDNDVLSFESFDQENYSLTYVNSGNIVPLVEFENITFSSDRKEVTVTGLTEAGPTIFTATCKINRVSPRKKIFNRCSSVIIDKSNLEYSGIGATTLNDGLSYNKAYGTRVQDKEISLNIPDVTSILAIYESSNTSNPKTPSLKLNNITSSILNTVAGEKIIGKTSNTVGYFVEYLSNNEIEYVSANENKFLLGEEIEFVESGIIANIENIFIGDNNITSLYELDNGYREQYLDFSRLIRKNNLNIPSKKIRVICNNYTFPNNNTGDIVSINSYDFDRYKNDLPTLGNLYASDFLDLRPAVAPYSGNNSPFEAKSRIFNESSGSTPHIISKNSTLNISYDFYLPRIDKLFLFKDGNFFISTGTPSIEPSVPQNLDSALEIATLKLPPYLRNISDITVELTQHKRYTMKDISRLEDRIQNIEYYTLLSLLELDTKNLIIRDDTTGLDRFKSGFFVDNFRTLDGGDVNNPDFKSSLDTRNGILRPTHYTTSLDLIPGSTDTIGLDSNSQVADLRYSLDLGNSNVKKIGDVICLNYNEVEYVKNPFATRTENVNPFNVLNWIGTLELNPSSDDWVETRRLGDRLAGTLEGDYLDAIRRLNIDTNTGLSPIQWRAWETIWTGVNVSRSVNVSPNVITTVTSTTTTSNQRRSGTQNQVTERFDTISLGDRVVSTSFVNLMRSRNIEIIARRLKPKTRFYAFFDDVNVTEYIIPKLIEVTMNSGTFIEGETVTGVLGSKQIRFRLASQNHKYGPVNIPTVNLPPSYPIEVYKNNIYNTEDTLSSIYSATTTVLNIDTASLEINGVSEFFGYIAKGMKLVGMLSKAVATVADLRIISDEYGTFIGSLFIPDPTIPSTPSFETGTKTLTITTSEANSQISGLSDSSGVGDFTSSGLLENIESSSLRVRNANIETIERSDQRTLQQTITDVQTQFIPPPPPPRRIRHTDPLAQSFLVEDRNGVYVTKCDIFFRTKDTNNIPITLQVRTVELGLPTQTILPFGEVTINPDNVYPSNNGKTATTFYFPSPIYLENGREYAIVLISASNEYNVWISRMGETDVTSLDLPESDRIIISQQPLLGSLFKSQNASTWDASQYEDLKFTLYRADFTTNEGSVRFYNPDLNIGNGQVAALTNNPILSFSRTLVAGIGKSFTTNDISILTPGSTVTQEANPYFRADLVSVVGSIGIGSTLIVTDVGSGFGNTTRTYNNVKLTSVTGLGKGAKANISVISGIARTVTVVEGGTGYINGDVLRVDPNDTNNLGRDLFISIPNKIGVITEFNSVLLQNIQGNLLINTTSNIVSNGVTISSAPVPTPPTILNDGLHFRVIHNNHGMYSYNNLVTLSGMEPDSPAVKLTANVTSTSDSISVSSVGILTTFENMPVNADNPGYVLINNEIIKYIGVDLASSSLTGIIRFNDTFIENQNPLLKIVYYSQNHSVGDDVFKYEFNGISLRRINKTHNLLDVDKARYPIALDSYHVKVDMSSGDKDRVLTNPLYFNNTKFGGSSFTNQVQMNTVNGPKATQNILMTSIRPNIQTLTPESTSITGRIRTISGTSISGNEVSFEDKGFIGISLNSNNFFNEPRMICSKINENLHLTNLPGKKSFTMELNLRTNDRKVSPMIDLDRVNIITTMNRIDFPVTNYVTDERVNEIFNDPHSSIYVSRLVKLDKPANELKVIFDAYRHSSNDIRVAYRIIRDNIPLENQVYELFPGYKNLDTNRNTIDQSKNDGTSDILIPSSNTLNDYKNYEFTAKNLPQFTGFQIKIMMSGTSQSNVPLIRDFRAIATL